MFTLCRIIKATQYYGEDICESKEDLKQENVEKRF